MNPQGMMQFMGAINTFKSNHPKFAAFITNMLKGGVPEGTIIEVTLTRPDSEPITSNMKVQASDIELFNTLKNMK